MSEPINDGGPVHPSTKNIVYQGAVIGTEQYQGISLRDYFASAAMAAMLSNPANYGSEHEWRDDATVSAQAYEIADDMLEERAK